MGCTGIKELTFADGDQVLEINGMKQPTVPVATIYPHRNGLHRPLAV